MKAEIHQSMEQRKKIQEAAAFPCSEGWRKTSAKRKPVVTKASPKQKGNSKCGLKSYISSCRYMVSTSKKSWGRPSESVIPALMKDWSKGAESSLINKTLPQPESLKKVC